MTTIIVDDELRGKLQGLQQPLELRDASGTLLGHVYPAADLSKWERWEPPYDEEELRRAEDPSEPSYTTAEVLEFLRKIP